MQKSPSSSIKSLSHFANVNHYADNYLEMNENYIMIESSGTEKFNEKINEDFVLTNNNDNFGVDFLAENKNIINNGNNIQNYNDNRDLYAINEQNYANKISDVNNYQLPLNEMNYHNNITDFTGGNNINNLNMNNYNEGNNIHEENSYINKSNFSGTLNNHNDTQKSKAENILLQKKIQRDNNDNNNFNCNNINKENNNLFSNENTLDNNNTNKNDTKKTKNPSLVKKAKIPKDQSALKYKSSLSTLKLKNNEEPNPTTDKK